VLLVPAPPPSRMSAHPKGSQATYPSYGTGPE